MKYVKAFVIGYIGGVLWCVFLSWISDTGTFVDLVYNGDHKRYWAEFAVPFIFKYSLFSALLCTAACSTIQYSRRTAKRQQDYTSKIKNHFGIDYPDEK